MITGNKGFYWAVPLTLPLLLFLGNNYIFNNNSSYYFKEDFKPPTIATSIWKKIKDWRMGATDRPYRSRWHQKIPFSPSNDFNSKVLLANSVKVIFPFSPKNHNQHQHYLFGFWTESRFWVWIPLRKCLPRSSYTIFKILVHVRIYLYCYLLNIFL